MSFVFGTKLLCEGVTAPRLQSWEPLTRAGTTSDPGRFTEAAAISASSVGGTNFSAIAPLKTFPPSLGRRCFYLVGP
ncbi:uncharacterized protein LOC142813867 isoform X2 [Rhipicephalus microplus]|uniref:uncharacterized protein LOC142813867 isoform X2 n=1 Tax=Rhipicephalus microplus TaxID=6941 RepID=UPI003F6D1D06